MYLTCVLKAFPSVSAGRPPVAAGNDQPMPRLEYVSRAGCCECWPSRFAYTIFDTR